MRISVPVYAVVAAFATLSLAAHAGTSDSTLTTIRGHSPVYYGDLNLATEPGAKIMLQRIERAAKRACGGHPAFSSYTGALDKSFAQCCDEAIQRAVKKLGAPMVTRIYSDTHGDGPSGIEPAS